MRVLLTIPHYVRPPDAESYSARQHGALDGKVESRVAGLAACLTALNTLFQPERVVIEQRSATAKAMPAAAPIKVDILICTARAAHILDLLPAGMPPLTHAATESAPELIGFTCHDYLRRNLGQYDYYGYLEDDLVLHDPLWFMKLAWFNNTVGDDKLLQPNRFEAGRGKLVPKVYVDGDLAEHVTAPFQDIRSSPTLNLDVLGQRIRFERTLNPHSGCFFLNARQMGQWARQPHFNDRQSRFIGPLETAASLGIMRTFKVYKPAPAHADFLEIQHHGAGYLDQLCRGSEGVGS
jgi:hypothetical protein